ncbi:MAG: hypothetical protein CUN55_09840 [Phototrophicales bacterium]|nr:MAG: hypothetical protein CUN55_09840 [Phototrophicales bacterium]
MQYETLQPIITAVEQACALTKRIQAAHLMVQHDKKGSPVTIGDYGAQAILGRTLHQHFPNEGVIAEESGQQFLELVPPHQRAQVVQLVSETLGETVTEAQIVQWLDQGRDVQSERVWMIDPIDGTKGFLAGRCYAVAVGIVVGSCAVAGIMGSPNYIAQKQQGMLFLAYDGHAYRRPLNSQQWQPIHVSDRTAPNQVIITEGVEDSNVDRSLMHHIYKTLGWSYESTLQVDGMDKYGIVASGEADVYLRIPNDHRRRANVWDHAAGVAILEAAGGKVTDREGNPLNFAERPVMHSAEFVIVTNGRLHDQVLGILAEV